MIVKWSSSKISKNLNYFNMKNVLTRFNISEKLFLGIIGINILPLYYILSTSNFEEVNKPWFFVTNGLVFGVLWLVFSILFLKLLSHSKIIKFSNILVQLGFVYTAGLSGFLALKSSLIFAFFSFVASYFVLRIFNSTIETTKKPTVVFILMLLWLMLCCISSVYMVFNN
jgi:hypothetical protein